MRNLRSRIENLSRRVPGHAPAPCPTSGEKRARLTAILAAPAPAVPIQKTPAQIARTARFIAHLDSVIARFDSHKAVPTADVG